MTLQEKIQKKAEGFGRLSPVFLEGAKFALENQWISVDNAKPCEYQEFIIGKYRDITVPVLTKTERLDYFVQSMYYTPTQGWEFVEGGGVEYWMPIPEFPKE